MLCFLESRFAGYADPPSEAGFAFQRFGIAASRKRDAHAADSARSTSLPDYRQLINPTGRNACAEGGTRLDDIAGSMAFSESEQSKNEVGGMVPLYAARVQDRGPAMSSCSGAAHVGTRPSFH